MIRMMMSIVPSDMAFSPSRRSEQTSTPASPLEEKHSPAFGSIKGTRSGLFRLQLQRYRIDAVAQSGRAGPVVEHVAEMAVAFRTKHPGPAHAVTDVALLVDVAVHRRLGKARPAAAGTELGVGFEHR